jgi:hypothetical protein
MWQWQALGGLVGVLLLGTVSGVLGTVSGADASAIHPDPAVDPPGPEARIWLDRGLDPVLRSGEQVRVYFRSNVDGYAALLQIGTDGRLRVRFPAASTDAGRIHGGQHYRLLWPDAAAWTVDEDPGMGYFFFLVSTEPLDFGLLRAANTQGGWDLTRVGDRVVSDPYVAVDEIAALLVRHQDRPNPGLDHVAYHVERPYAFPRFLCYGCHVPESYGSWNPYHRACTDFRVVIYNDPYFYPSARFQGTRVVHTRPPLSGRAQFDFEVRTPGQPGSPLVRSRTGGVPAGSVLRELVGGRPAPGAGPSGADPGRPILERRSPDEAGVGFPGRTEVQWLPEATRFPPTGPASRPPFAVDADGSAARRIPLREEVGIPPIRLWPPRHPPEPPRRFPPPGDG